MTRPRCCKELARDPRVGVSPDIPRWTKVRIVRSDDPALVGMVGHVESPCTSALLNSWLCIYSHGAGFLHATHDDLELVDV